MKDRFYNGPDVIALAAPTGFGKTRLAQMFLKYVHDADHPWAFYTHRKMLFSQTRRAFEAYGLDHGCRASGYEDFEAKFMNGQMVMIPSELAALESGKREIHKATVAFIDEAHNNKSAKIQKKIIDETVGNGGKVFMLSATPIGLGGVAQELVDLCSISEARKIGAILPAVVKAPCEADLSKLKASPGKEFSKNEQRRIFMNNAVIGHVYRDWVKYNVHAEPTILFAPDVQSSVWFVDYLIQHGVKAAHIDGSRIYYGEKDASGEPVFISSMRQENRDELAAKSKSGEIQIVCNRFVLVEGVDWPWLYHGIFAVAFNTENCWVQACGRILRNWPTYDKVLITDHGGNVYRPHLGSPNEDREWKLEDTDASRIEEAVRKRERNEKPEAVTCPNCKGVLSSTFWKKSDRKCYHCGHVFTKPAREVIQLNGELKTFRGPSNRQKKKREVPAAQKDWNSIYYPSSKSKNSSSSNFNQLKARFEKKFPQYQIQQDGTKTVAVNLHTNQSTYLENIPSPNSAYWEWEARKVNWKDLQRTLIDYEPTT